MKIEMTDATPQRGRRIWRRLIASCLLVCAVAVTVAYLLLRFALSPAAHEWSTRLRWGPVDMQASVPAVIRLATEHWMAPVLDGRRVQTAAGPVRVHAVGQGRSRYLQLDCAPCSISVPGAGRLDVALLRLEVSRSFNRLQGRLAASDGSRTVQAQWQGTLLPDGLTLELQSGDEPMANWYAVLAPSLPELAHARIDGRMSVRAQLVLPQQRITVTPEISGFFVSGLGTQALAGSISSCGRRSALDERSWLARAVLAAEDQRFYGHGGFDLRELGLAHSLNQRDDGIRRGGSTISQQLAKLLFTDGERTVQRKMRELLYAVEMEQTLGKARILALYLDNAPWGDGICGADAAARHYFQRPPAKLTPAQAVWLASMLHNPQLEAQRWQQQGQINLARARWVADQVRGVRKAERQKVLQMLEQGPQWVPPDGAARQQANHAGARDAVSAM